MSARRGLAAAALSVAACALLPAGAGAVIGGTPVPDGGAPWFVTVGGCGGTLIAPDRVVTAGHCVQDRSLAPTELGVVVVGGVARPTTGFAMAPGWRTPNPGTRRTPLDDVAIVGLAEPVVGVPTVALAGGGDPVPGSARIVGAGRSTPPGVRADPNLTYGRGLQQATLRTMSDAACGAAWRGHRGNEGERFDAARMLCGIDADGRAPLSSGCNGDSGGPFVAGPDAAPVLLGVVSWGGDGCGADHLPSVFAEVARYRAFLTDPTPAWAPATARPVTITGARRVGGTLRCTAGGLTAPATTTTYAWHRQGGRDGSHVVGRRSRYRVRTADGGHELWCGVTLVNAGGRSLAPAGRALKIPRG